MDTLITVVLVLLAIIIAIPVGVLAWLLGLTLLGINNVRLWYTRKRRAKR